MTDREPAAPLSPSRPLVVVSATSCGLVHPNTPLSTLFPIELHTATRTAARWQPYNSTSTSIPSSSPHDLRTPLSVLSIPLVRFSEQSELSYRLLLTTLKITKDSSPHDLNIPTLFPIELLGPLSACSAKTPSVSDDPLRVYTVHPDIHQRPPPPCLPLVDDEMSWSEGNLENIV